MREGGCSNARRAAKLATADAVGLKVADGCSSVSARSRGKESARLLTRDKAEGKGNQEEGCKQRAAAMAAAEEARAEEEGGGNDEEDEERVEWEEEEPLAPFDLFRALGLTRDFGGGDSRVRSSYHKIAVATEQRLRRCELEGDAEGEASAWLRLRRATVAFGTLLDPGRRDIYLRLGYAGLKESEKYAEMSVFDEDPLERLDRFFRGSDEADREYLLLNGVGAPSSSEDEGDDREEDDEDWEDIEALQQALANPTGRHKRLQMDSDDDDGLPVAPVGVLAGGVGKFTRVSKYDPFAEIAARIAASS